MSQLPVTSLAPALSAPLHRMAVCDGVSLAYYASTPNRETGDRGAVNDRPVVLLHSINAAPSAMEMKPLFEALQGRRPVYAPELPGFGQSQRGPLPYSATFYAQCIADFLSALEGPAPDVVAFSLSCEFVARAVVELGVTVNSLTLLSPTGLSRRAPPSGKASARIERIVNTPLVGQGLFSALTSRPSIRFFLGQAFGGSAPQSLVDYAYQTAHQPGARFGPFAFLTFKLFSTDALETLYARLDTPTLLLFDRDPNVDFDRAEALLAENANVRRGAIGASHGMPQWEQTEACIAAMEAFYRDIEATQ